jgi:hypothetical protein
MKNLKLLALALVIGSASLFANTTSVLDIPAKQIAQQVSELFDTPEFNVNQDLKVMVVFTFDTEGKIVVLKVDSKDPDVLRYIRQTLKNKSIDTPGEPYRQFTLPLTITEI